MRLKYLDISGNRLEGTLPLKLPPNLKQFDCSRNLLSGQIKFEEIPSTLVYFDVSQNPSLGGRIRNEWVLQCPVLRYWGCKVSDGSNDANGGDEGWDAVMKGPVLAGVSLAKEWDMSGVVHCFGHDGTGHDMKGKELVAEVDPTIAVKKKKKGKQVIAPIRPTAITKGDGSGELPLALGGVGIDCARRMLDCAPPNDAKDKDGRGVGYVNWQRLWLEGLNDIGITATYDIQYEEPRQGWREYHVDAADPPGRMRSLVGGRGGFNTRIEGGWYKEGDRVKADYECRGKLYIGKVVRRHRDDIYVCFTDAFRAEFTNSDKWHGKRLPQQQYKQQYHKLGKSVGVPISTACKRLRERNFFDPHYKVAEGVSSSWQTGTYLPAPAAASPLDWERRMIHQVAQQHGINVIYKRLRKHTSVKNPAGVVPMEVTRRPVWYNYLEVQQAIWIIRCYAEGRRKGGLLQPKVLKEIPQRYAQVRHVREAFVLLVKGVEARIAQEVINTKKFEKMMAYYDIDRYDKYATWYVYLIDEGLEKFAASRFVKHIYENTDSAALKRLRTDELDCVGPDCKAQCDKFPIDYRFARSEPEARAREVSRGALEEFMKIYCPDELASIDHWLQQYSGEELVHDAYENYGAAPKYRLVEVPEPPAEPAEAPEPLGEDSSPTQTKEAWGF
jgi:hypothetical protein